MDEDQTQPRPVIRGRGALIMKALQSLSRHPDRDASGCTQPTPSVPPPVVVSFLVVRVTFGNTVLQRSGRIFQILLLSYYMWE